VSCRNATQCGGPDDHDLSVPIITHVTQVNGKKLYNSTKILHVDPLICKSQLLRTPIRLCKVVKPSVTLR